MPVSRWYALPEDLGHLTALALSDPKRPEGLCVTPRTASKAASFSAHATLTVGIKQQMIEDHRALFMLGINLPELVIRRLPKVSTTPRPWYIDLNNCTTVVEVAVPGPFVVEERRLLASSRVEYSPTKFCSETRRRVKAPLETARVFQFLKKIIRSMTEPGIQGLRMTPAVKNLLLTKDLLVSRNGFWYDGNGNVRGTTRHPSGFAKLTQSD